MQDPMTDSIGTPLAKIQVLGATGRLIVAQAVARGYDVTVLVRPLRGADACPSSLCRCPSSDRKARGLQGPEYRPVRLGKPRGWRRHARFRTWLEHRRCASGSDLASVARPGAAPPSRP